jgi:hypothetical protein
MKGFTVKLEEENGIFCVLSTEEDIVSRSLHFDFSF